MVDVSSKTLSGSSFSVALPNSQGARGLDVADVKHDDGTLAVYVLWHEK